MMYVLNWAVFLLLHKSSFQSNCKYDLLLFILQPNVWEAKLWELWQKEWPIMPISWDAGEERSQCSAASMIWQRVQCTTLDMSGWFAVLTLLFTWCFMNYLWRACESPIGGIPGSIETHQILYGSMLLWLLKEYIQGISEEKANKHDFECILGPILHRCIRHGYWVSAVTHTIKVYQSLTCGPTL